MRTVRFAVAAALVLILGACGGDDDTSDGAAPSDDAGNEASDDEAADDEAGATGDCAGTDLSFTNLATGEAVAIVSTAAVSLDGGAAYTAYAADFDIDMGDVDLFSNPAVPADGNLVTLAVTVFNATGELEPLAAGTEVEWTDEFGVLTFVVTHLAADELFGNNTDAAGTVSITGVGDTFCAEIDYRDAEKELAGTIEASVTAL